MRRCPRSNRVRTGSARDWSTRSPGDEVAAGERGILVHCDLANFNSVTTILTEDVGVAVDGGFLLLGRAVGAQAKGCSLAVEEFIQAAAS